MVPEGQLKTRENRSMVTLKSDIAEQWTFGGRSHGRVRWQAQMQEYEKGGAWV